MRQITLKPFQIAAINDLKDTFLILWKEPGLGRKIVFQSPTGSGKTIMMAEFLRGMTADPRFTSSDVAYIWITNSDDLATQSKNKLWDYYHGAGEISLHTSADVNDGILPQNGIFFVNWQKLVQNRVNMRPLILRTEGESNTTFDKFMANTHAAGRDVVLIIDEEHIASNTVLANDLTDNVIKPRIIIGVSATPQSDGAKVEVKREDVIAAGLIKEKIVFQTADDLHAATETDQDKILLELAFNKRNELIEQYQKLGLSGKVNPLVLIQLPNDDQANKETNTISKREIVEEFLHNRGVSDDEIAVWLSDIKENLADIEKNNARQSFLLFKQAAATGWDCPRASALLVFREIRNPAFATQIVGRILRMPFGEHFPDPVLNRGYLFTNYTRNEVLLGYSGGSGIGQNRPAVFSSFRKEGILPIRLESTIISRTDYNDLGVSFEKTFEEVANQYFQITDEVFEKGIEKLSSKGLDTVASFTNSLIVGVAIDDYDNFISRLKEQGTDVEVEMSQNDVEHLYERHCFDVLSEQTEAKKKYAPERSWGKLKTALNVWFRRFYHHRDQYYRVIVKDLSERKSGNSVLAKIISEALGKYRAVRDAEVDEREKNKKRIGLVEIPPAELSFTDLFEEFEVQKCAMTPFYLEKEYIGRKNESAFIRYLENNPKVIWWHKNGEYGHEYFAIPYFDNSQQKERSFYPDWIVKTENKVWIIDTKAGWTVEHATDKNEALALWLADKPDYDGGMVVLENNSIWEIIRRKEGHDRRETLKF